MILTKVWGWLKKWDARRTILALLIADTILAEVQVLRFFAVLLWEMRDAYVLQNNETIRSSDEGFTQVPSYSAIRIYFIVIGALLTRFFTNWVLFDGLATGSTSQIQAGVMGTGVTTPYITAGGFIFCISQYLHFGLEAWLMALMLLGLTVYAAISVCFLAFVWREKANGRLRMQPQHVIASIVLVFGGFVAFVHVQILSWVRTLVFKSGGGREEKTFALMNEGSLCNHGN